MLSILATLLPSQSHVLQRHWTFVSVAILKRKYCNNLQNHTVIICITNFFGIPLLVVFFFIAAMAATLST